MRWDEMRWWEEMRFSLSLLFVIITSTSNTFRGWDDDDEDDDNDDDDETCINERAFGPFDVTLICNLMMRWDETRLDEMRWDEILSNWKHSSNGWKISPLSSTLYSTPVRWDEMRWDEMRWRNALRCVGDGDRGVCGFASLCTWLM